MSTNHSTTPTTHEPGPVPADNEGAATMAHPQRSTTHLSLPPRHANERGDDTDDYSAEPPVDLRNQSLRPAPEPEPDAVDDHDATEPGVDERGVDQRGDVEGDDAARDSTPVGATADVDAAAEPAPARAEAGGQRATETTGQIPRVPAHRPGGADGADHGGPRAYSGVGEGYSDPSAGYPGGFPTAPRAYTAAGPEAPMYGEAAVYAEPAVYADAAAGRFDPDPAMRGPGDAYGRGASAFLRGTYDPTELPAQWGWRGRFNAALGTKLRPTPESAEAAHREAIERIRQALPGMSTVSVINVKGGQGKTPTSLMLSNTMGMHRGGGVVGWDANESKGTLAMRAAVGAADPRTERTVWDVLEHAKQLCSPGAESGMLDYFLRRQPTQDEILASDSSSKRMAAIGWEECAAIMAVLRRHRSMVIIDTGNDDLKPNWRWATENTDQLVIPMTYRKDSALAVAKMLDGLLARDLQHLVASAIVVMTATPGASPEIGAEIQEQLRQSGVHRFFDMPYEPQFDGDGAPIRYDHLGRDTVHAYTLLAAEVADSLATARDRNAAMRFEVDFVPESIRRPVEHDVRGTRRGYAPGYPPAAGAPMPTGPVPTGPVPYPPAAYGPPTGEPWPAQQPAPTRSPFYRQGGPQ
ncbi:hypothetical protein [Gordonia sp. N1V]|uniref:MinD/ParA family ATP-binding protein n=1 Tax=Gordonia sp. N1V TaxID=3034163 RepID=UPI0023E0D75A|nr:hypothetical protein [Gordonia sp. N1V]MDF3285036.1 hypothetical protein [Gordonia sp. N1V]